MFYQTIKENPEELITDLKTHKNESEYFYDLRALDREENFENLSNIKKASRVIFLNKTCYNGLYRVNNSENLIHLLVDTKIQIL